ncbi:MAG TPA: hypothetical protein VK821_10950 [Dehalococcoidia bacterium]|nr:hypothetical protein [Dehalococcoidia bacterium]
MRVPQALYKGVPGWRASAVAAGLVLGRFIALLVQARPVLAHAVLLRSNPAANAKLPTAPKVISL